MSDEKIAGLPDHLAPLLDPTPSGVAKLVAAWDGLNTESQVLILMGLDTAEHPAYLSEKVRIKALDSANAYVRYMAARRFPFSRDDSEQIKAVKQRIEEDPYPLVRYCLLESSRGLVGGLFGSDLEDAGAFFALPHEARLAKVRSLYGSGTEIANLISHAVDHEVKDGRVSAIEVFEILSDYVNKTEFKKHYAPDNESDDGLTEYGRGQDIAALWRLVLKVPEYISDILIKNLPPGDALSSSIPDDVLSGMSDGQLATLFNREDIELKDLRKKVFFESDDEGGEVKYAAIRYNFDIEYAEFGAILASPKNKASKSIDDLTWAGHLSLCLYEAIYDVLLNGDVGDALDSRRVRDARDGRLEQLKGWQRERQLRDLNLYQLAKTAVPWKKGEEGFLPSEELEFLSKAVVEGDTWGTFVAYSNVLEANSPDSRTLEKYLSQFDDPSKDGASQAEKEDEQEKLLDRVEEKLTDAVSGLTELADVNQLELKECLRELGKDFTRLELGKDRQTQLMDENLAKAASATISKANEIKKQLTDDLDQLTGDVSRLRATQQRESVILYFVIGLLAWLLFKIW